MIKIKRSIEWLDNYLESYRLKQINKNKQYGNYNGNNNNK